MHKAHFSQRRRVRGGFGIYVMRVRWLPLSVCAKVQGIEVRAVHGLVQAKNRPRQPSPERLFAFPEKFFPKSKIFFTACQIIFITNFVTHITNLLIRVTNFVTLVRNFVTKTILYEREKYLGHRKKYLAYPKKYLGANALYLREISQKSCFGKKYSANRPLPLLQYGLIL